MRLLDTGLRLLDAGMRLLDAGLRLLDGGLRLLNAFLRLLDDQVSSSRSSSRTYLSAHFQQPIARTYLSTHFQQPIASQPLFHSLTTFTVRGKTGEDGVEA